MSGEVKSRPPCDPSLCPDHKAHQLAIDFFNGIVEEVKSDVKELVGWKNKAMGFILAITLVSSFLGASIGSISGIMAIKKQMTSPTVNSETNHIAENNNGKSKVGSRTQTVSSCSIK